MIAPANGHRSSRNAKESPLLNMRPACIAATNFASRKESSPPRRRFVMFATAIERFARALPACRRYSREFTHHGHQPDHSHAGLEHDLSRRTPRLSRRAIPSVTNPARADASAPENHLSGLWRIHRRLCPLSNRSGTLTTPPPTRARTPVVPGQDVAMPRATRTAR